MLVLFLKSLCTGKRDIGLMNLVISLGGNPQTWHMNFAI